MQTRARYGSAVEAMNEKPDALRRLDFEAVAIDLCDHDSQLANLSREVGAVTFDIGNAAHRVQHRRMITPTECAANFGKRARRKFPAQLHRDLARAGNAAFPARAFHVAAVDFEELRNHALDIVYPDRGLHATLQTRTPLS